jgi:hypothetical protein
LLAAIASIEAVTLTDYHANGLTTSARLYALILPIGALSLGAAFWLRTSASGPARWLDAPIVASLLGVLIGTSSLGLVPSPRPLPQPASYATALLIPPLMPDVQVVPNRLDGLEYASPLLGQQCWAIIPCSAEHVPGNLHLLDPREGVRGGLGT